MGRHNIEVLEQWNIVGIMGCRNIGDSEQWNMSEQWGGVTLGVRNNGTCRNNGVA
jgi:hypothetical protein